MTSRLCVAVVLAASMAWLGPTAPAQFDLSVERGLLLKLLRDGRYKQALAESRRIEESLAGRPAATAQAGKKPRKQQVGPATLALVELLIYRGTVERRMGNLDDAEKTLAEAYTQVTNPDFQRLIQAMAPAADAERQRYFAELKLPYLQLLDNGTEVLLDRLRKFNYERQAAVAAGTAAEISSDQRDDIESLFHRIDTLVRVSMTERGTGLAGSSDRGAEIKSPYALMMFTRARPYRLAGMRYLEASRLPWTIPFDADPATVSEPDAAASASGKDETRAKAEPPPSETERERETQAMSQRLRAVGYLEKSRELATPALAAASSAGEKADSGTAALTDEDRVYLQEANRISGETAVPLSIVAMLDGDLVRARKLIDETLAGLHQAESPTHPELARPLMISAELALKEGKDAVERKAYAESQKKFDLAVEQLRQSKELLEAVDSEFDPQSPLHRVLANLLVSSEEQQKRSRQAAASATAADAAARRALAALAKSEAARKKQGDAKKPPSSGDPGSPAGGDPAKQPGAASRPPQAPAAPAGQP